LPSIHVALSGGGKCSAKEVIVQMIIAIRTKPAQQALNNIAISGVAVLDFLGDSSSFHQGSSINDAFGGWFYFPFAGVIAAHYSQRESFTYTVPNGLPDGVYTVYIGTLQANGDTFSGGYARIIVGEKALPPVP
jgi:hypothetical protein